MSQEAPLPRPGPQAPPAFVLRPPVPIDRSKRWSALGSGVLILAFSLRLLGDKWEHQARRRAAPLRRGAVVRRGGAIRL